MEDKFFFGVTLTPRNVYSLLCHGYVMDQTPTEEELRICRLLPEHKWEVGDLYYFYDKRPLGVYLGEMDGSVSFEEIGGMSAEESFSSFIKRVTWLPHPHQIMKLECWDINWCLRYNSIRPQCWFVEEYIEESCEIVSGAPTARFVCLRAIEPYLEK